MAYQYTFCVTVGFVITIEHVFSDQEIQDAGGSITTAFEYLESDLQERLDLGASFWMALSAPKRRRSDCIYSFEGSYEVCRVFPEDCVVDDEELYLPDSFIDELKAELEIQWQAFGENVSIVSIQAVSDVLLNTEERTQKSPC
jgi:hypothetical protein